MADYIGTLERMLDLSSAKEGKTYTDYKLRENSYLLVFSKEQLDSRIAHYGDNSLARTLDYSKALGRADAIRIVDGRKGTSYRAKYGRKWVEIDYHYCAYTHQPCAYA